MNARPIYCGGFSLKCAVGLAVLVAIANHCTDDLTGSALCTATTEGLRTAPPDTLHRTDTATQADSHIDADAIRCATT